MTAAPPSLEVLFAPAEFGALPGRDLSRTICVVFDVLRATSTIVTALANGAAAVVPVSEIAEAVALRGREPAVLLGGERDGLRIRANLTGGIDFDLGNSPREFTSDKVRGKTIALTTTNGSRALRACAAADTVLACCLLNLRATAEHLKGCADKDILLVCGGSWNEAAYEDALGAGALVAALGQTGSRTCSDSAHVARLIYERYEHDLMGAVEFSRNGRRLLGMPELRDDVAFCLTRDRFNLVAKMQDGKITGLPPVG